MKTQTTYAISPELLQVQQAAERQLELSRRQRHQVDETDAQIRTLEAGVNDLAKELADRHVERAIADDADAKRLDAELKKLITEHDSKTRELSRTRILLEALEAKGPEIDNEIRIAATELQSELSCWTGGAVHALTTELQEAAKPLLGVLAKARALRTSGSEQLRDFLSAAFVPADPGSFMRLDSLSNSNVGTNLLNAEPSSEQATAAADISEALAPVLRTLRAAKGHPAYVPLAKRPKPYVRRGYTTEGLRGNEAPFGEGAKSPQPRVVTPTDLGRPLSTASGRSRVGYAGEPAPGTGTEANVVFEQTSDFLLINPIG